MIKLEQLPQAATETLGALIATPALYRRIVQRQARPIAHPPLSFNRRRASALALCAACTALLLWVGLPAIRQETVILHTQPAGQLPQNGYLSADIRRGSIRLVPSDSVPAYQGVWAKASGANFPMIRVDGAYYRLLTSPAGQDALRGEALGVVDMWTEEPALDGSRIVSNVAQQGAEVYAVGGMAGSAIACQVDGSLRIFQRVSFDGSALLGGETLSSTLGAGAAVAAMQLSDVGTVADAGTAQALMQVLLERAQFASAASRTTKQALLIQFDNGLVLQMAVKGNQLMACGAWDNPDFIQAFSEAVQK